MTMVLTKGECAFIGRPTKVAIAKIDHNFWWLMPLMLIPPAGAVLCVALVLVWGVNTGMQIAGVAVGFVCLEIVVGLGFILVYFGLSPLYRFYVVWRRHNK